MYKDQEWINLSKEEFRKQKYEYREVEALPYFKPTTGLWFSLPSDTKYLSEWGDYVMQDNNPAELINSEGETNITTVKLNASSYVITLNEWKQIIEEVLKNTPHDAQTEQKRKLLLTKIKQELKADNIEHLVFVINENEFYTLKDMYYMQPGEKIREAKKAKDFDITHNTLTDAIGFRNFINNFDNSKENILKKIELLEQINKDNSYLTYDKIEKYLDEDDEINIQKCKFYGIQDNDEILQHVIQLEKKKFGHLTAQMLSDYKNFLTPINSLKEYKVSLKQRTTYLPNTNQEVEWIVSYFSGCVNKNYIPGYDMPSLAIFDTECIDVISQKKEKIFETILNISEKRPTNEDFENSIGDEMLIKNFDTSIEDEITEQYKGR